MVSLHFSIALVGLIFGLSDLLKKLLTETWFQLLVVGFHHMCFAKRLKESQNSVLPGFV